MKFRLPIILLFTLALPGIAAPFALSDSDPDSPEFRNRFLATHGVNSAIEPELKAEDRPLQEALLPHLRDNPRQAIMLIERALTPELNPAFLHVLGNLYYQVDDYANAERYLRQTLEKFPSLRRSWRTLALTYVQRDKFADAVAPWLKVIELGGGDAQSYGLLAYSYLSLEKYESALAAYRMARMFKPDSLDFRRGQAQCLLMTEQHRAAIALFDELIAEQPGEAQYWMAQANSFLALDRPEWAIANLEIIADGGKATWESLLMLGDLHLNADAPTLALAAYSKAVREHTPASWKPALRPLKYLLGRRLFAEARDYLALLRQRVTTSPDAFVSREIGVSEARIQMEIGDAGKAFVLLKKIVEADPLDGVSLLLLGEYHLRKGNFEEARYHFERATSVDEQKVEAHVALGRLAVARGDLQGALTPLREAQSLRGSSNVQRYIESIEHAIDSRR
jgi:tetratricopeptide (TPR) repeat protein